MSYPTVPVLEQLWRSFDEKVKTFPSITKAHFSDIKKLTTAESVIDLSMHEIYFHTGYVHALIAELKNLKTQLPDDKNVEKCCEFFLDILKQRNKIPLKIKHHKKMDAECDFRFSLQLMVGNPLVFKEIQVLDPKNQIELKNAIRAIHRLDCIAEGLSFAELPLMHDTVLSTMLEYKDTVCLLAKDQNNQIVGHCWGIMLKDVENKQGQKANIFWVMDLAKDPDFTDANVKVGDQLRASMLAIVKQKKECDFIGYQHVLDHKFHMNIISDAQDDDEQIHLNDEKFAAKTKIKYDDTLNSNMRGHFIKISDNNAYPDFEKMNSAVHKALWQASHSVKDFILGGIAFFGRMKYQKLTHPMLNNPIDERLTKQVSQEQQICDMDILKQIILSNKWTQQGKSIFNGTHVPTTMYKLQALVQIKNYNFQDIKLYVNYSGTSLTRSKLTALFYNTIGIADSPTFVLNTLLSKKETPKEWIALISNSRKLALQMPTNVHRL